MKIKCRWNRGAWTDEENKRLTKAIAAHGYSWTSVSEAVATRSPDQCAKHWTNSLDPEIDHGAWTEEDDRYLMDAVYLHGRAWKRIAGRYFPSRSTLEIANRYNLNVRRREQTRPSNFVNLGPFVAPAEIDQAGHLNLQTATLPSSSNTSSQGPSPGLEYNAFEACMPSSEEDLALPTPWEDSLLSPYLGEYLDGTLGQLDPPHESHFEVPAASPSGTSATSLDTSACSFDVGTEPHQSPQIRSPQICNPPLRTHRTSLTMTNLDPETRNEILDILCKRRISTTIDMS
jgi:hypothetical protein